VGTHSLSIIIICHFLQDIRHRNEHPNGTISTSLPLASGSFQAAAQHIQDVIMEEFGDPPFEQSSTQEQQQGSIELQKIQSQNGETVVQQDNPMLTTAAVDLNAFP